MRLLIELSVIAGVGLLCIWAVSCLEDRADLRSVRKYQRQQKRLRCRRQHPSGRQ